MPMSHLPTFINVRANDPRIQVTSRENWGIARTRNHLLYQASGQLIAVMDADDVALPERFALQVAFLQSHPHVVCVGGSQDWIDEDGRLLFHLEVSQEDTQLQAMALSGNTPINHPSAMIRREALLQVGGYGEHWSTVGDLDLLLRLGEVGKLANLADTVLKYRQHPTSTSEMRQLEQIEDKREACRQAWERRGITGRFEAIEPWRPIDRSSRYHYLLRFGWQFFYRGQRQDALAYGIKSVKTAPLERGGWKLLAYALIKPLPNLNRQ
jgi:glycosyltransferase involved in cell wall biosynthesis